MTSTVEAILAARTWADTGFEHSRSGLRRAQSRVHPDICREPGADDAFMRLQTLFDAPDVDLRLAKGRFRGGSIAWEFATGDRDLLERALEAQGALWKPSEPVQWVPEPIRDSMALESRYGPGWWFLSQFGKLDGRTVAWVWKRLLAAIATAESTGWVHGDINASTVALLPSEHGLRLDGWWTAVPVGSPLSVSPTASTPPAFLSGDPVDSRVSVAQAADLLLQHFPGRELGALLGQLRLRPVLALEAFEQGERAIQADYGPPKWHVLETPTGIPAI